MTLAPPAAELPLDDPVALTQALVRCASVTPEDHGALDIAQRALEALGFSVERLPFSQAGTPDVDNLYARRGSGRPHFAFAGHTDVVPPGALNQWSVDPFAGEIRGNRLIARGAADMKGAIACFLVALKRYLSRHPSGRGTLSLIITGDEEGPAINGTKKVLEWMAARGERPDACLTGEPTNPERLGEMIKIGRRGSLNAHLTVHGVQAHVGYPHLADNPIHRLLAMLAALRAEPIDQGTEHFQPSHLEITTIDVGNEAINIIPAEARARFNVRFNTLHTPTSIEAWIRQRLDAAGGRYDLSILTTGEAFLTSPGPFSALIARVVERVTGLRPALTTLGGTSDSRFIKNYCPVLDFGLVGATMHKVDEAVPLEDLRTLSAIYEAILEDFFAR